MLVVQVESQRITCSYKATRYSKNLTQVSPASGTKNKHSSTLPLQYIEGRIAERDDHRLFYILLLIKCHGKHLKHKAASWTVLSKTSMPLKHRNFRIRASTAI